MFDVIHILSQAYMKSKVKKVKISLFQQEHCMYITIDRNNTCHQYSVNAENG